MTMEGKGKKGKEVGAIMNDGGFLQEATSNTRNFRPTKVRSKNGEENPQIAVIIATNCALLFFF